MKRRQIFLNVLAILTMFINMGMASYVSLSDVNMAHNSSNADEIQYFSPSDYSEHINVHEEIGRIFLFRKQISTLDICFINKDLFAKSKTQTFETFIQTFPNAHNLDYLKFGILLI